MKERASLGQFGMTDESGSSGYSGIPMPLFVACFNPSGQLELGDPSTETILLIWSISEFPWNRGLLRYISATIHPTANTSTAAEYDGNLNSSQGARYHRVEMYSVYGGLLRIYRLIPKSMILTVNSLEMRIFSGFISRWKKPCLCTYSKASDNCFVMYRISYSSNFSPFSFLQVINLQRSFSIYSKTKQASLTTRMTSFNFMILGWFIFLSAFTYDN